MVNMKEDMKDIENNLKRKNIERKFVNTIEHIEKNRRPIYKRSDR